MEGDCGRSGRGSGVCDGGDGERFWPRGGLVDDWFVLRRPVPLTAFHPFTFASLLPLVCRDRIHLARTLDNCSRRLRFERPRERRWTTNRHLRLTRRRGWSGGC